jgi:hypothetical protein
MKPTANPVLWLSIALCIVSLAHMGPDAWSGLGTVLELILRLAGQHPDQRIPFV